MPAPERLSAIAGRPEGKRWGSSLFFIQLISPVLYASWNEGDKIMPPGCDYKWDLDMDKVHVVTNLFVGILRNE